nr:immunoglobulin heavy chain junction region [Mus musculus]
CARALPRGSSYWYFDVW